MSNTENTNNMNTAKSLFPGPDPRNGKWKFDASEAESRHGKLYNQENL